MLWSCPHGELGQISRTAYRPPRRRPARTAQPEQRLKRGHRGLTAVVPKHELVEIGLQVVTADAVVRPDQPLLQVPDGAVRQRHDRGDTATQGASDRLRPGDVPHARRLQPLPPFQAVGVDRRPWLDVVSDKAEHRGLFEVGCYRQADTPGPISALFRRDQHDNRFAPFQLATAFQPGLRAANPGVVDLHVAMQRLASGVHHRTPKFVQHEPRGLVSANAQLALQQQRGDAALVGRHQVRRPKPGRQRGLGPVEHRPGRQRHLVPTPGPFASMPFAQWIRSLTAAARTVKPGGPSTGFQILPARRLIGELLLELPEAGRERRTRHGGTLLMVAS
jgi:hypothetical protein